MGEVTLHFLSGVTAGDKAQYDVAEQTRIVFDKISTVLDGAGSQLKDIVKLTVFLADIREYSAYNAVRNEIFALVDPPPASTCVEALLSQPFKRIEIEVLAVSR
jgi:2-iminobutanoate/2-iminopropanoate deaminase